MKPHKTQWAVYASILAQLPRGEGINLDDPMRQTLIDKLIADKGCLLHDGQRATALEVAVETGAERLCLALPDVGSSNIARLDLEAWTIALSVCSRTLLQDALSKGLQFHSAFFDALTPSAAQRKDVRDFVLFDLNEAKWIYDTPHQMVSDWQLIPDGQLAADFLTAQVARWPRQAANLYRNALANHARAAIILHVAGAADPNDLAFYGNPLEDLVQAQPSNHAKLAVRQSHGTLTAIHDFYS